MFDRDQKVSQAWKVMLQDMSKELCDQVKTLAEGKKFIDANR